MVVQATESRMHDLETTQEAERQQLQLKFQQINTEWCALSASVWVMTSSIPGAKSQGLPTIALAPASV